MKYRLAWVDLENEGVFSGEAPDTKTFLTQAIQAGISSLDWTALYVWDGENWQDTGVI